jgi:hypothetical protein
MEGKMKVLIEIPDNVKKNIDGYAAGHKAYQLSLQDVNNLAKIIANGEVVKDTFIDLEPTIERYRKEADAWDQNGLTPFEITEKVDAFCVDEMRGILADYFSNKFKDGIVIVRDGNHFTDKDGE